MPVASTASRICCDSNRTVTVIVVLPACSRTPNGLILELIALIQDFANCVLQGSCK
jgi:hypothetical protein